MRKTPSYLKGLAEDRARADGEVRRLQGLLDELAPKLAEAKRLQALERDISARQSEAKTKRDACDTLIRSFDSRLDPDDIEPIRATKGRYGKRGMLRTTIIQILERVAPAEIATTELRMMLELELQLCFSSQAERNTWSDNSLLSALRNLAKEGLVDRLHDPMDHGSGVGRWRWKGGASCGLSALSATAVTSGVGVSRPRPKRTESYLGGRPFIAGMGCRPFSGPLGLAGCGRQPSLHGGAIL